ncbi:hypothetical protein Q5752_001041 [Cryptotrichosporon argae]
MFPARTAALLASPSPDARFRAYSREAPITLAPVASRASGSPRRPPSLDAILSPATVDNDEPAQGSAQPLPPLRQILGGVLDENVRARPPAVAPLNLSRVAIPLSLPFLATPAQSPTCAPSALASPIPLDGRTCPSASTAVSSAFFCASLPPTPPVDKASPLSPLPSVRPAPDSQPLAGAAPASKAYPPPARTAPNRFGIPDSPCSADLELPPTPVEPASTWVAADVLSLLKPEARAAAVKAMAAREEWLADAEKRRFVKKLRAERERQKAERGEVNERGQAMPQGAAAGKAERSWGAQDGRAARGAGHPYVRPPPAQVATGRNVSPPNRGPTQFRLAPRGVAHDAHAASVARPPRVAPPAHTVAPPSGAYHPPAAYPAFYPAAGPFAYAPAYPAAYPPYAYGFPPAGMHDGRLEYAAPPPPGWLGQPGFVHAAQPPLAPLAPLAPVVPAHPMHAAYTPAHASPPHAHPRAEHAPAPRARRPASIAEAELVGHGRLLNRDERRALYEQHGIPLRGKGLRRG